MAFARVLFGLVRYRIASSVSWAFGFRLASRVCATISCKCMCHARPSPETREKGEYVSVAFDILTVLLRVPLQPARAHLAAES